MSPRPAADRGRDLPQLHDLPVNVDAREAHLAGEDQLARGGPFALGMKDQHTTSGTTPRSR